jgi:hypothetical protein
MTSPKKPGMAFWATVVVVAALVAYPLSFGPACWLATHANGGLLSDRCLTTAYWPILQARHCGPDLLARGLDWYACVGTANGWIWLNGYCHQIPPG